MVVLLSLSLSHAQTSYSGIFQESDADYKYIENQDWETFSITLESLQEEGFRLIDIETSGIGDERRYWGIFTASEQESTYVNVTGWVNFVKEKRAKAKEGFVLIKVQSYPLSESEFQYIGIWRKGDLTHKVWRLDSAEGLAKKTDEMARDHLYLKSVEVVFSTAGIPHYLAIYHYNPLRNRNYVFITDDARNFGVDWLQRVKSKNRIIDYERYELDGETYYLGVYQPGEYETLTIRDQDKLAFDNEWERLEKDGMFLVDWEIW